MAIFIVPGGGGSGTPGGSNTQVQFNNNGSFGGSSDYTYNDSTKLLSINGNITSSGTVTSTSDETVKENIKTITDALLKLMQLRGVEYDRKDIEDHQIGVIAQEVERIVPEVVYEREVQPGVYRKSVAYGNLVGLLIEAMKEQEERIQALERRLEALE